MSYAWNTKVQAGLAIVLFLGALGTLLYNASSAITVPQRELELRASLEQATQLLAESAESVLPTFPLHNPNEIDHLHRALSAVADRVLAKFSGVEGGFYLADLDRFSAYSFPTADPRHPIELHRTDPPPLETPLIRLQASHSLGERIPLFIVQDVGPSRVMVVTEAVGATRPAHAASWTMVRLTGPEQLHSRLQSYQVSVALALAGLALSLALTFTLTRSLAGQRAAQERLREELRRSEQLAALGKLVAGVAHEIRNPLAGIRSTIQLWQRMQDPVHILSSVDTVLHATERLNAILTRLLHFAKTEQSERHPVQINELVDETNKLIEAQGHAQGVKFECHLEPGLPFIMGDQTSLLQVLLNLATNALQAMPDGGILSWQTRHDTITHMVEVIVTDTGPGVSEQDRKHLFEPFFTTRQEGTGLGLALCREIVVQHGGLIELLPETGATFRLRIPTGER